MDYFKRSIKYLLYEKSVVKNLTCGGGGKLLTCSDVVLGISNLLSDGVVVSSMG